MISGPAKFPQHSHVGTDEDHPKLARSLAQESKPVPSEYGKDILTTEKQHYMMT